MRDLRQDLEDYLRYKNRRSLKVIGLMVDSLPHAIDRALRGENFIKGLNKEIADAQDQKSRAEAEVERLQKQLEVVERHCKETFAEIRIQHHDEIEKYKQALRIFTNVDIPIEDKCWFKGVSIHAPARGATICRILSRSQAPGFNPRTRTGCDRPHI